MRHHAVTLLAAAAITLLAAVPAVRGDEEADLSLETCAMCHDEVASAFQAGPHGRAMAAASPKILARSCVTCHRPSPEHVDDPSPENVHRTPPVGACASCHQDRAGGMELATPGHPRNGVSCLDCHASGHNDPGTPHMLRAAPSSLCAGCHQLEAARFQQPYAHREGASRSFSCLECHSIHGGGETGRTALLGNGGVCIRCHTEKAGPFIYPHPPREVDGCVTCHDPHGSQNPRQLRRRSVADLCLECHPGIGAFHDLSQARYRACQTCHTAVHGSNRDPRLLGE